MYRTNEHCTRIESNKKELTLNTILMHHSMPSHTEEDPWLENVKNYVHDQLESRTFWDVCVFQVPKSLRVVKPEDYEPQMVSLGPYGHLKPELQEMEGVKLDALCRLLRGFQISQFELLTGELARLDAQVQASYHKRLELKGEKLAGVMAVDSAFLFYFLCNQGMDAEELKKSQHLGFVAKPLGRKLAEDAIVRDVMMLENQVPFFFVKKMLALLRGCDGDCSKVGPQKPDCEKIFFQIAVHFCKARSPIKWSTKDPEARLQGADKPDHLQGDSKGREAKSKCEDKSDSTARTLRAAEALDPKHLLDLLYRMIMKKEGKPEKQEGQLTIDIKTSGVNVPTEKHLVCENIRSGVAGVCENIRSGVAGFWKSCKNQRLNDICRPLLTLLSRQSYGTVGKVGKGTAEALKFVIDAGLPDTLTAVVSPPPVTEDFLIPQASHLEAAGVKFLEAETIHNIKFDKNKATLYLPVIEVGVNTEVIIRNLVAYEAMVMRKSQKFSRYIEVMSGLIDTDEDVKVLREKKILISHVKDADVTTIFNNTSKSIQLSDDGDIDTMIKKLNNFYNDSMSAKLKKARKLAKDGFSMGLAVGALIAYLLLVFLQSFCSAYDCARLYSKSSAT